MSNELALKLLDFSQPFKQNTDAPNRTLGGVLVQNKCPIYRF